MKWLLLSLILIGCSSSPSSSGGAGGTGGAAPAAESGGATPGGGTSGVTGACSYHDNRNECGTCTKTLAEFCAATCSTLRDLKCFGGVILDTIQRGCGVVIVTHRGDVGDVWGEGYDEATGALIYAFNNGRLSFGCRDAWTAGAVPECDFREVACDDLGADAGGDGGGGDGG
jgi:hypothetical protein